MMRAVGAIALGLALALIVTSASWGAPGSKGDKPPKIKELKAGDLFCPSAVLVFGNVIIQSGRCYLLFVLRDSRGTFLAFADPNAKIPPGQIVRLSTPAGAKVKGRIFYLVPLQPTAVIVPLNSMTLVAVKAEDFGPKLSLTIVGTPSPNLTVIFSVRL